MTRLTSRGPPAVRVSPKAKQGAKPCAWVIGGVGRSTNPAILRDPESGEPRCASHAVTVDEVS